MFEFLTNLNLASLFGGAGVASILWSLFDKRSAGSGKVINLPQGDVAEEVSKLRAELSVAQEEADKVADLHSYTRQLEAKIQLLEAATGVPGSEEHEMRVKVLEKQLSEKAELEAKLAVAMQELSDYKAKAEMFDSVVSGAPVTPVAPAATPVAQPVVEPVIEQVVEPVVEPVAVAAPEAIEPVEVAAAPASAPIEFKETETVAANVTEPTPEVETPVTMEVVQNEAPIPAAVQPMVSSTGAAAAQFEPVVEERTHLRVEESVPMVSLADNRDPLENIDGIGPVYQQKLYEAGIKTFAQLAAASPSRITEIIEPQNWQHIDVMKWRRESALYASGEKA